MKQLECELCGSTKFEQQGKIYVCQSCGCRYSEQEVKKMMDDGSSEKSGSVKVNNTFSSLSSTSSSTTSSSSSANNNYLSMARNAISVSNYKEAEFYCNRVLEEDLKNWEAWFIKGKAVGWQTTFYNLRLSEAANSFIEALANCPKEKQISLAEQSAAEMIKMNSGIIRYRLEDYCKYVRDHEQEDINKLTKIVAEIVDLSMPLIRTLFNHLSIDLEPSKKFMTFFWENEGGIIYSQIVSISMSEALERVNRRHRKIDHPDVDDCKRYYMDIASIALGIEFVANNLGNTYDNELRNKQIIQLYEKAIEIAKNTIGLKCYSVHYNYDLDRYYVEHSYMNGMAEKRNEWQQKILEIKRVAPARIAAAAQKRTEDYWKSHSKEKEKLQSELNQLSAERNSLQKTISDLEMSKNGVPAKPYLDNITNNITAWQNQKNTVPGVADKANIEANISDLQYRHSKLGIFKGKEKKAIELQIEEAKQRLPEVQKVIDYHIAGIDAQLAPLIAEKNRLQSIVSQQQAQIEIGIAPYREKLKSIDNRINEINTELNKPR